MFKSSAPRIAAVAFAFALAACNASTAHIGGIQLGKDKAVSSPTTSFGEHDAVYAKADASNLPNKVTMQWQLVAVNVKGEKPNTAIPSLNESVDLDSDGTSNYNLTPPPSGWPDGTYKITVTMMDNGTQRDQKSIEFTAGTAPEPAGTTGTDSTNSSGDDAANNSSN